MKIQYSVCDGFGHNRQGCPDNPNKNPPRITESRSQRAARLYEAQRAEGMTLAIAGERFGISREAVRQARVRMSAGGVEATARRTRSHRSRRQRDERARTVRGGNA